jgi:hypothetical protein
MMQNKRVGGTGPTANDQSKERIKPSRTDKQRKQFKLISMAIVNKVIMMNN